MVLELIRGIVLCSFCNENTTSTMIFNDKLGPKGKHSEIFICNKCLEELEKGIELYKKDKVEREIKKYKDRLNAVR